MRELQEGDRVAILHQDKRIKSWEGQTGKVVNPRIKGHDLVRLFLDTEEWGTVLVGPESLVRLTEIEESEGLYLLGEDYGGVWTLRLASDPTRSPFSQKEDREELITLAFSLESDAQDFVERY